MTEPRRYFTLEDAAQITGMTEARLRQRARKGLPWRGSLKDPLFAEDDLIALGYEAAISLPTWLFEEDLPQAPRPAGRPPTFALDKIVRGNVLDVLPLVPTGRVSAVVCSPPYWGQRIYKDETAVTWADNKHVPFGREDTPEDYVIHSLQVLKGLLRVLTTEGTVWWNIADSYFTRTIARASSSDRIEHYAGKRTTWAGNPNRRSSYGHSYLKDKDLCLIPFQIAIGAQRLGYWVRSIIIWSKQQDDALEDDGRSSGGVNNNHRLADQRGLHVPEVVQDRPVTAHEYILLLAKSERYDYKHERLFNGTATGLQKVRTVWTFPPAAQQSLHGARYPEELPRRCILLGSDENDLIFDPFAGEGTTLRVAKANRRHYFGCDVSPTYVSRARDLISRTEVLPPTPTQPELPQIADLDCANRERPRGAGRQAI